MERPDKGDLQPIFLADFEQKGLKRAKTGELKKNVSLLLSSLILGKCLRNIVIFPLTQIKIVFFLSPNSFKKGTLLWDRSFLLSGRIFLLDWPKSSAKSLQHC